MESLQRLSRLARASAPALFLLAILLLAAGFRFYGLDWDGEMDANPHPDERHLANTMSHVSLPWPPNWRNLADPAVSTLNPRRVNPEDPRGAHYDLAYGTLPVYLYRALAALFSGGRGAYAQFFMLGRVVTALLSLLTVLLVYLIGRRLFGRRAGLLASALLAVAVTHIQLSHFMTVDAALTLFATAALYAGVRLIGRRRWYNALLLGLMVGFAMACKVSGLTLGAVIVAAGVLLLLVADSQGRRSTLLQTMRLVAIAGAGVVLGFGMFEFYVFLDPATYREAISSQAGMVSGEDWPFTRQYVNTPAYLYHLDNLARWGLGWPLLVAGVAGAILGAGYLLYVLIRRPGRRPDAPAHFFAGLGQPLSAAPTRWGLFLLLAWALPYFFQIGRYEVKFVRYMLPLAPVLCLLAGWLVILCAEWARRRILAGGSAVVRAGHLERLGAAWATDRRVLAGLAYALLVALVFVPTFLWAFAFSRIYSRPHTWAQASRWLYANAPDGSVMTEEVWDDSLPVSLSAEGLDRGRRNYRHVSMNIYHDMRPEEKLKHIAGALTQADYVILATPRLYGAVRRLPWRYPVEIRYYELLFQGQLGFELAYSATSYPSLWGKAFVDDAADESFSVYDHPKTLIYRKTRQLSEEEFRRLFDDVLRAAPVVRRDLDDPPVVLPVPKYQQPLLLDRPVGALPAVGDWAWNPLGNAGSLPATLLWLLALLVVGAAAWPLAAILFPTFPERGALLARPLGLMLVAYLSWLPASLGLWHYTVWAVVAAFVLTALLSLGAARWRRLDLRQLWRQRRNAILVSEAVFLAGFLIFLLIRIANPDLWHPVRGGEKPMEFGFLNAILRSPTMPPLDPFFSDGYINYYYYGLFAVSTLIKLTGIRSSVAFNLIIPTLAAMTIGGAFAVAWALTGRRLWGAAAGVFTTLIGNLAGAGQIRGRGGLGEALDALRNLADPTQRDTVAGILQGLGRWIGGRTLPLRTDWFWDASRAHGAYENTITEFPLFSFLFADLHPHTIGIPFGILLMALALSLAREARQTRAQAAPLLALSPALALGLGTMAVNNSWDFPVYLLLVGGAFVLGHRLRQPAEGGRAGWGWALLAGGVGAGALGGLGLLLYAPFFTYFKAFVRGLGMTTYPTEVNYYLGMFGFFIYPLATLLLGLALWAGARAWRQRRQEPALISPAEPAGIPIGLQMTAARDLALEEGLFEEGWEETPAESAPAEPVRPAGGGRRIPWRALLANLPLWAALLIPIVSIAALPALYGKLNGMQMLTFILLGELILVALLALTRADLSDELRFVALLTLVGLLVSLGVEVVYVKDHLGGTWYRMNTIFKFYIQVWILLSIGAAAALGTLVGRLKRRQPAIEIGWWAFFLFLLAASLVYPLFGIYTRVNDRFPLPPARGTLDGQAYMLTANYDWEGKQIFLDADYRAIRWLEDNLVGTPIVLQAAWEFYRANGVRIAYNTGYPTVLNPLHEDEQRYPDQKARREQDVYRLYNEPDAELALDLLKRYNVDYVYIGLFERAAYAPAGVEKFAAMTEALERVYDDGDVQIYQVKAGVKAAGGASFASAPAMAVPTVPPRQATARDENEIKRLRQLADANPANAGLQFDLGNRLRQAGQFAEAVEVFKRSLKYNPQDVAMYQTLGDTYQEMGRPDEALVQYEAATKAAPKNAAAFNKLGVALAERERWEEAIRAFQKVISLDPAFAEAYYHWGQTLERAGRAPESIEVYQQLIGLAPNNDWAKKAQERLKALQAG